MNKTSLTIMVSRAPIGLHASRVGVAKNGSVASGTVHALV